MLIPFLILTFTVPQCATVLRFVSGTDRIKPFDWWVVHNIPERVRDLLRPAGTTAWGMPFGLGAKWSCAVASFMLFHVLLESELSR